MFVHGPFIGQTSQDQRLVMRTRSHTRLGIRFGWRGTCENGATVLWIARLRNVPVDENGRFFVRCFGIGVRGKRIPALRGEGICRSGLVTWDARR